MNLRGLFSFAFAAMAAVLTSCSGSSGNSGEITEISPAATVKSGNALEADTLFVVASQDEAEYVVERYGLDRMEDGLYAGGGTACVVLDAVAKSGKDKLLRLKADPRVKVVNIGYCASDFFKVGDVVEVCSVARIENPKRMLRISDTGVPCLSSDSVVRDSKINGPCVFDRRLANVKSLFPNVLSCKIVRENLSGQDSGKFDKSGAWERAFLLVDSMLKNK